MSVCLWGILPGCQCTLLTRDHCVFMGKLTWLSVYAPDSRPLCVTGKLTWLSVYAPDLRPLCVTGKLTWLSVYAPDSRPLCVYGESYLVVSVRSWLETSVCYGETYLVVSVCSWLETTVCLWGNLPGCQCMLLTRDLSRSHCSGLCRHKGTNGHHYWSIHNLTIHLNMKRCNHKHYHVCYC